MEEISAFQTSVAMEMAVANEIEDPAPWVDVSVLGSTALIPPPEDIHSSYVALPTGITSYVDLPFSFNVGSSDYIYPEDVEALLDGTDTIGEMAAAVNENEAQDLIKELLDNEITIQNTPIVVDDVPNILPAMTLKVGWGGIERRALYKRILHIPGNNGGRGHLQLHGLQVQPQCEWRVCRWMWTAQSLSIDRCK